MLLNYCNEFNNIDSHRLTLVEICFSSLCGLGLALGCNDLLIVTWWNDVKKNNILHFCRKSFPFLIEMITYRLFFSDEKTNVDF